jgi:hypothetical protein
MDKELPELKCLRCNEPMEKGFVMDFAGSRGVPARWVVGEPQKTLMGEVAYTDRENKGIAAYRCRKCGHLELFANEEPWFKDLLGLWP